MRMRGSDEHSRYAARCAVTPADHARGIPLCIRGVAADRGLFAPLPLGVFALKTRRIVPARNPLLLQESPISYLKNRFGMRRSRGRGADGLEQTTLWAGIANNLAVMARSGRRRRGNEPPAAAASRK